MPAVHVLAKGIKQGGFETQSSGIGLALILGYKVISYYDTNFKTACIVASYL